MRPAICPNCGEMDNLKVNQRECNHSAFNSYRYTPSDYSQIICLTCRWYWHTKATYVSTLPDMKEDDW